MVWDPDPGPWSGIWIWTMVWDLDPGPWTKDMVQHLAMFTHRRSGGHDVSKCPEMSRNRFRDISGHFRTHFMLVVYSKKIFRGFGLVNLLELSKNYSETGVGAISTVEKIFLSILPRVRNGADFGTFQDISGHSDTRIAPQGISGHFRTANDSIIVKRKT